MFPDNVNTSLDVSVVVYKHSEQQIAKVLETLIISAEESTINKIIIFIIDNHGNFSGEKLKRNINKTNNLSVTYEIKVLHPDKNLGYGKANNLACNLSDSKYHLVLNPDVFFDRPSIANAINYLDHNYDVVLVSPKIENEKGIIVSGIKRFPSFPILFLRFLDIPFLNKIFKRSLDHYACMDIIQSDIPQEIIMASGCCMLFKKEALKKVGGFNEDYFLYFEDFDLSLRTKQFGEIHYLPSFKIKHLGGNTGRKGFTHIRYFIASMFKFFRQYKK
ncbi:glycosyltransferase [Yersinia enterocolitica]